MQLNDKRQQLVSKVSNRVNATPKYYKRSSWMNLRETICQTAKKTRRKKNDRGINKTNCPGLKVTAQSNHAFNHKILIHLSKTITWSKIFHLSKKSSNNQAKWMKLFNPNIASRRKYTELNRKSLQVIVANS